ncbi:MAG: hypothetical protein K6F73_11295, partial [Lachnospiraceae bacterium]|nr:hypothetical protein [Lachnospiraceae bacterium]
YLTLYYTLDILQSISRLIRGKKKRGQNLSSDCRQSQGIVPDFVYSLRRRALPAVFFFVIIGSVIPDRMMYGSRKAHYEMNGARRKSLKQRRDHGRT